MAENALSAPVVGSSSLFTFLIAAVEVLRNCTGMTGKDSIVSAAKLIEGAERSAVLRCVDRVGEPTLGTSIIGEVSNNAFDARRISFREIGLSLQTAVVEGRTQAGELNFCRCCATVELLSTAVLLTGL